MYRHAFTALAIGVTIFGTLSSASDLSALTDDDRSSLHEEIRSYLINNPEVLVEAMDALNARQEEAQQQADLAILQSNASDIFDDGYSWVGGNPDGDITLVEFMDYRCGYCRRAYDEIEQLLAADGNIRFVVKEFPILGEASTTSARFAVSTLQNAGPDAYKQVHDALVQLKGEPTEQALKSLAETLGLDADAILQEMNSDTVNKVLQDNLQLAQKLNISGTPTFILPNQVIRGYVPVDGMIELVTIARDAQ